MGAVLAAGAATTGGELWYFSEESSSGRGIVTIDGVPQRCSSGITVTDDVLVSVLDDDESVRESLPALLRAFGFNVRAFDSAESFLASDAMGATGCLILDVAMPGMSGPELFEQLKRHSTSVPVIFITAQGGEVCQRLLAGGAVACLQKPFDPMALVEALRRSLSSRRRH